MAVCPHAALVQRNVSAEGRRAAALDRAHYLHLHMGEVTLDGTTPGGAVIAKNIYRLFCQLLFTQAFLFKQLRLFERIAERPSCARPSRCRPSLTATRHDG